MEIDHDGAEWPYLQLYHQLREAIIDGTYPVNRPIPSLVTISQETGLNKDTIRKVFRMLAGDGLVRIIKGKGTYVISQTPRQPPGEED